MRRSGVLDRSVLVYGQMNEPPGARWRVGLTALTIAEYFRDQKRQNVLLLMDNVFRFVSVTAIEAVYVLSRWLEIAVTAGSVKSSAGMIVLSRSMAAEGMYPAVDPLSFGPARTLAITRRLSADARQRSCRSA